MYTDSKVAVLFSTDWMFPLSLILFGHRIDRTFLLSIICESLVPKIPTALSYITQVTVLFLPLLCHGSCCCKEVAVIFCYWHITCVQPWLVEGCFEKCQKWCLLLGCRLFYHNIKRHLCISNPMSNSSLMSQQCSYTAALQQLLTHWEHLHYVFACHNHKYIIFFFLLLQAEMIMK